MEEGLEEEVVLDEASTVEVVEAGRVTVVKVLDAGVLEVAALDEETDETPAS